MGFWKRAYNVVQDVTSLGGTYRLREALKNFERLKEIYERVCVQVSASILEIATLVASVEARISLSNRRLRKIGKMLNPVKSSSPTEWNSSRSHQQLSASSRNSSLSRSPTHDVLSAHAPTVAGLGAGAIASTGSWAAVQITAHASTGATMAGLHGIAASNAGWAWFGGGSLAAGGGGMALGHLILPGIGSVVAVAVSAKMSHSEADKVENFCRQLTSANEENTSLLSKSNSQVSYLNNLETRLLFEDNNLTTVMHKARRRLFKFGYLSHLWRLLIFWLRGYYYKSEELIFLDELSAAASKFVNAFKNG
jgi:hypothetical protein